MTNETQAIFSRSLLSPGERLEYGQLEPGQLEYDGDKDHVKSIVMTLFQNIRIVSAGVLSCSLLRPQYLG